MSIFNDHFNKENKSDYPRLTHFVTKGFIKLFILGVLIWIASSIFL